MLQIDEFVKLRAPKNLTSRLSQNVIRHATGISAGLIVLSIIAGCGGKPVSINEAIGRYEYHSGNKGQGATCFVLSPDGTYFLGDAKEPLSDLSMSGSPSNGTWRLGSGTGREDLLIGGSALPIEGTSSSIRVTVNDDLGMYCDLPLPK